MLVLMIELCVLSIVTHHSFRQRTLPHSCFQTFSGFLSPRSGTDQKTQLCLDCFLHRMTGCIKICHTAFQEAIYKWGWFSKISFENLCLILGMDATKLIRLHFYGVLCILLGVHVTFLIQFSNEYLEMLLVLFMVQPSCHLYINAPFHNFEIYVAYIEI